MTNLHEASDVSATLSETDLSIRRFRGGSYEEALAEAESELGEHIRVIGADRIRRGGLGGFFATDLGVEVAVVPVASDERSTPKSIAWGSDTERAVSDLDWDELMRRVEADDHPDDQRRAARPDRALRDPASVGLDHLLDEAERSDRSLSSWAREDDDFDLPEFLRPAPSAPEQVEPEQRSRHSIIDGGDGGSRLLGDVLAQPAVDTSPIIDVAPVLPVPAVVESANAVDGDVFDSISDYEPVGSPLPAPLLPVASVPAMSSSTQTDAEADSAPDAKMSEREASTVERSVTAMPDPLRRPTELATIAVGRLATRLAELPSFSGGLQAGAYRVNVAVTTPDGTRIEMSTQVDGSGD